MGVKEQLKEANERKAYNVQRFLTEDPYEREKRIQNVCGKCLYSRGVWRKNVKNQEYFILFYCNYDTYHQGQLRPCAGRDCVEKGVFVENNNKENVTKEIQSKWSNGFVW